jgi:hypothetical protein
MSDRVATVGRPWMTWLRSCVTWRTASRRRVQHRDAGGGESETSQPRMDRPAAPATCAKPQQF